MERISIDTIGPLPADMGLKYIIVMVRVRVTPNSKPNPDQILSVELFPKQEVTAIAVTLLMRYGDTHVALRHR
jgi:hypothetical protein